jgi:hypothetical protein
MWTFIEYSEAKDILLFTKKLRELKFNYGCLLHDTIIHNLKLKAYHVIKLKQSRSLCVTLGYAWAHLYAYL